MRLFHKLHKRKNPRKKDAHSNLCVQNAMGFECLYADNPKKYDDFFQRSFGEKPRYSVSRESKGSTAIAKRIQDEVFPSPEMRAEISKKLAPLDDARLREIQKSFPKYIYGPRGEKRKSQFGQRGEKMTKGRRSSLSGTPAWKYVETERAWSNIEDRAEQLRKIDRHEYKLYKEQSRKSSSRRAAKWSPGRKFQVGDFFGLINEPGDDDLIDLWTWELFDPAGKRLLSGSAKNKSHARQAVNHASNVVLDYTVAALGGISPPYESERFVQEKEVHVDENFSNMLRRIKPEPKLRREIRDWFKDVELGRMSTKRLREKIKEHIGTQRYRVGSSELARELDRELPSLALGEEVSGTDTANKVKITIRRGRGGYFWKLKTTDRYGESYEREDGPYKTRKMAEQRANFFKGMITGIPEYIEANPSRKKRLAASLKRNRKKYFKKGRGRRKNPPKRSPVTADIMEDFENIVAIPDDAEEAFRAGFFTGLLRGIDTCGVQNYFTRQQIRKKVPKLLAEAHMGLGEKLVEGKSGRRGRVRYSFGSTKRGYF